MNHLLPPSVAKIPEASPVMTTAVTDFSVQIETKARKDQDIEAAQKPEKVDREILPATGVATKIKLLGFAITMLGFILIYKDRSEVR